MVSVWVAVVVVVVMVYSLQVEFSLELGITRNEGMAFDYALGVSAVSLTAFSDAASISLKALTTSFLNLLTLYARVPKMATVMLATTIVLVDMVNPHRLRVRRTMFIALIHLGYIGVKKSGTQKKQK